MRILLIGLFATLSLSPAQASDNTYDIRCKAKVPAIGAVGTVVDGTVVESYGYLSWDRLGFTCTGGTFPLTLAYESAACVESFSGYVPATPNAPFVVLTNNYEPGQPIFLNEPLGAGRAFAPGSVLTGGVFNGSRFGARATDLWVYFNLKVRPGPYVHEWTDEARARACR